MAHLENKYGETPDANGLSVNGAVVEVLTSADGETWTILATFPDGRTCLIAAGTHWQRIIKPEGTAA